MRPNKLTVQAFGPFANQEQIDFDRLGENPLFLINGPTGAGKSSILDAICFALYGQTTGNERDATQMRCDHADAKLLTEVTLDFILGKKLYRVRRRPTQERPKARGEGTTTQQTEAQLWELNSDGSVKELLVAKKASEATEAVISLTGLKVEQFRQVMVLPQGKFRDFLMADSANRETIFSQLFETQIYKRLEYALKEEASGIKKDVESLNNQISGILQSADLNSEAEVQSELSHLKNELKTASKAKQDADKQLKQAEKEVNDAKRLITEFQLLADLQAQQTSLENDKEQIGQKQIQLDCAKDAESIKHRYVQLNELQADLKQRDESLQALNVGIAKAQAELEQAKLMAKSAEEASVQLDPLKLELKEMENLKPKVDQLKSAQKSLSDKQAEQKSYQRTFDNAKQELTTLEQKSLSTAEALKGLRDSVISLPDKHVQKQKLEVLGRELAKLDGLKKEVEQAQKAHVESESVVNVSFKAEQAQSKTVKTLELKWHQQQAQILATELTPGEACPVCGSTEHPAPANSSGNKDQEALVSTTAINQEKSILVEKQTVHGRLASKHAENIALLKSKAADLDSLKASLGENAGLSTQQLRDEWSVLNQEIEKLEANQKQIQNLEREDADDMKKLALSRKQLEAIGEQLKSAEKEVALSEDQLKQLNTALPVQFRDVNAIEVATTKIEKQIKALSDNLAHANNQVITCKENADKLVSADAEQKKEFESLKKKLIDVRTSWENALLEKQFVSVEAFNAALLSSEELQVLEKDIASYKDNLNKVGAKLEQQQIKLKDKAQPEITEIDNKRLQFQQQVENATNTWSKLDGRQNQLNIVQEKLDDAHAKNAKLESEYKVIGTLSDVANGQTGKKISLQRFVLSVLLDDVLVEASHRLQVMSKGRYLLVRKEDKAKGNKASGLELEVEDAYTGKTRSVATLSGGESFMAALSLALGLSDVVQAYAGGIKLDTLFIDEGFGSLDQESLDLAIKTLIDLQSSGRMIGIISHVSELKEQMALRVDVNASAKGSSIALAV